MRTNLILAGLRTEIHRFSTKLTETIKVQGIKGEGKNPLETKKAKSSFNSKKSVFQSYWTNYG
jgi:hypothetical protein